MSHDDQSIREVSMALRQLVHGWDRYRESIAAELGVGTTEVLTLGHLHQEGPLTPRDIGRRLGLTSGSVTALLNRLVASGFVARSRHPDDRRSVLATATPAGRHAMDWFYEQLDEVVGATLAGVPDLRRDALIELATGAGQAFVERADHSG